MLWRLTNCRIIIIIIIIIIETYWNIDRQYCQKPVPWLIFNTQFIYVYNNFVD